MVSAIKAIVAFFLVGLFFVPVGPLEGLSYSVTDIDGHDAMDLVFAAAGTKTVNITVPQPFKALSAEMNITGSPSIPSGTSYPHNVTVDVGSDGKVDWAFNGTGYGALGRQDRFSDGSTMKEMKVADTSSGTYELLIPKGATVTSARMTLVGAPTPTEHYSSIIPNEHLENSTDRNYTVKGIEPQDIAINSSVALKDVSVLENTVDVNQSRFTDQFPLVTNYMVAQSFRINRTDPKQKIVQLRAIEVYFNAINIINLGMDLMIYNSSKSSNYRPTGPVEGTSFATYSQWKNNYLNFSFSSPLELEPDRVYTMLLGDIIQGVTNPMVGFNGSSSGSNANSPYPIDGCFMQVSTNGGNTWTPYNGADLTFKTHVDMARPIAKAESSSILVDGKAPTATLGATLYFNQTARYSSSGWNFKVSNKLPMSMLYNMSAILDCNDAPDHVVLDVGNDSIPDWTFKENFTGQFDVPNLDETITSAVQTSLGESKGKADAFENILVPVPIRISSLGNGTVRLTGLHIEYNLTVGLPNLKDAIIAYQATHGGSGKGPLTVPITITSSTSGIVHLSSLKLVYDGPPKQIKPIPAGLTMTEEGLNSSMLGLDDLFVDDFDAHLAISVQNVTTSPKLNGSLAVTVDSSNFLSIDARGATNWSGNLTVLVNATDSNNFTTVSDPINITITNINDAPVFTSTPPKYATVGQRFEYNFSVIDSDSPSLNLWLDKAPPKMDLDRKNMSITWTPGVADIGRHNFSLMVSDGALEAQQNISLTVRSSGTGSNHAPQVQKIADQTISVGTNLTVQVTAYDPDHDLLEFSFLDGPANMTVNASTGMVKWRPDKAGNFTSTIRVSDGDLWVDISFNITVLEKSAAKPMVSIQRPLSGEKVSGVLTVLGKASAKGTALVKVEFSIDGSQWYSADLQPDGSWSADVNTKNLSKGDHTLVVRATDTRGQMGSNSTTFELKGKPGSSSGAGFMGLLPYLLLLMVIIVIIVLAIAMATHRSKGGRTKKTAKARASKTVTGTETKDAKATPLPGPRSEIDSAFLVYHDGRLITYASRSEIADLDATLQVIKDFVKASFRGDVGRLDALRYENMNIILERGVQMYLVVITPEGEDLALQSLRRRMRSFLGEVHERYKHILKVWDGKYKSVKPIEKMVTDYVKGPGPSEEIENKVGEKDEGPPEEEKVSKRWDESPDLEDKGLSNIEKQRLLHDRLTRGEITEKEFGRLTDKLK